MKTTIRKCCTNIKRVIARYNCSSVTCIMNYNKNKRNQAKEHNNICMQMPVFKCYIGKTYNWHANGKETQDE